MSTGRNGVAVPYTLKIRSGCEGGGKGALVQTNKSATIKTCNDQYLFQPVIDKNILDDQGGQQISVRTDEKAPTQRAEMHGNVPCVLHAAEANYCISFKTDASSNPRSTINASDKTAPTVRTVHPPAVVYSLQGNTIDRNAQQNGSGICENVIHTLNSTDRHGVAYAINGDVAGTLDASYYKGCGMRSGVDREIVAQPCIFDKEVYNSGKNARGGHYIAEGGPAPSLRTEHPPGVAINYIVRRLTPTECARLQGFPDWWGHIVQKESLTPEEYAFWLEVRNTHAAINGRAVKEYTEAQMLTWYNKLHTDSAEYKMWGNGIALPPALYCMQGIADALKTGPKNESV